MGRKRNLPSKKRIREFWAPRLVALGKGYEPDDFAAPFVTGWGRATETEVQHLREVWGEGVPAHDDPVRQEPVSETWRCFACGKAAELDRAHIDPLQYTDDNSVSNLHMLCRPCHVESEWFSGEHYWRWLLSKPFLHPWHPDHFAHVWAALGVEDERHFERIIEERYGPDIEDMKAAADRHIKAVYDSARPQLD